MSFNKNGSSGRFVRVPSNVQIPDKIDWRDLGAVTPVKNQGFNIINFLSKKFAKNVKKMFSLF